MKPIITRVTQTAVATPTGVLGFAYNVQFTVGPHGPFTIQIPESQFTAAEVNKRVNTFAAELSQLPIGG
jgi:hypothetical protein